MDGFDRIEEKRKELFEQSVMKLKTREEKILEIRLTYLAAKANYESCEAGFLEETVLQCHRFKEGDWVTIKKEIYLVDLISTNADVSTHKLILKAQKSGRKGKITEVLSGLRDGYMIRTHFPKSNREAVINVLLPYYAYEIVRELR